MESVSDVIGDVEPAVAGACSVAPAWHRKLR